MSRWRLRRQPVETGERDGRFPRVAGGDIPSVAERTDAVHQFVEPLNVVEAL